MYKSIKVGAIVAAGGSARRMGFDKLLYPLDGVEVLRRSVAALGRHPYIDVVVVAAGESIAQVQAMFEKYPPAKPLQIVPGGACRAASVAAGLAALPADVELVAVHDGARPFTSEALISRVVEAAAQAGAAAPALPVSDTIKSAREFVVEQTLPRENLFTVQTPQVFRRKAYAKALAALPEEALPLITDDCMVMERAGHPVRLVEGEAANRKITRPEDLEQGRNGAMANLRIGHGYDVHRLVEGRPLVLGGVAIPWEKGLAGHSDADVLLHAVADALLGAAALGDIGLYFPDTDPAFQGADSLQLLAKTVQLLKGSDYRPHSIDATLVCQAPKLAGHLPAMRKNLAAVLGLPLEAVSVKATTEEGLGFTGTGQGIAAHCVAMLVFAQAE